MPNPPHALDHERQKLLARIEDRLEFPLVLLGLVWLVLVVMDLVWGLSPRWQRLNTLIWVIFLIDFLIKLWLAPRRWSYLRHNWLTVLALVIPALRVFRIARAISLLRAARA